MMALLNRIFSTARKKIDSDTRSDTFGSSLKLAKSHVRLLLFKENDLRGRKLLYDSFTIDQVKDDIDSSAQKGNTTSKTIETLDGVSYKYRGPSTDENVLGDMIYGAVAVAYKGSQIKIHLLEDPLRLLCSKVFIQSSRSESRKNSGRYSTRKNSSQPSTQPSVENAIGDVNRSKPLQVPRPVTQEALRLSLSFERGDSGFCNDHSPQSSISSNTDCCYYPEAFDRDLTHDDSFFGPTQVRKVSVSSNGSWQRRMYRSMSTRFDFACTSSSGNMLTVPSLKTNSTCESQIYSNSSNSGTNESLNSNSSSESQKNNNKLGFALLITLNHMELLEELSRHIAQLEAILCRCWRKACEQKPSALAALHEAGVLAHQCLEDLLFGPRILPLWLNMVASKSSNDKLAETLITDICFLLHHSDTKHTNFFISTLLSHVLTFHLAWVSTVSPYEVFTESEQFRTVLMKKHPYNALWAQLNDLCGNIGLPSRSSKTIVCGKDVNLVKKIITVLTYFIRCGVVNMSDESQPEFTFECVEPKEKSLKRTNTCSKQLNQSKPDTKKTCDISLSAEDSQKCKSSLKRSSTTTRGLSTVLSSVEYSEQHSERLTESSNNNVVFVLGENEKLIGIKNKTSDERLIKKSQKAVIDDKKCDKNECCSQQSNHSKPIKHSGYKFEFEKYPQIVTNYMKSKNLEILDRHYLGKPGNLKLDSYQFDPSFVFPIKEEKCEICQRNILIENNLLQTPTNASELEFMSDMPSQSIPPQHAIEVVEETPDSLRPKSFVKKNIENTIVINPPDYKPLNANVLQCCDKLQGKQSFSEKSNRAAVNVASPTVLEFNIPRSQSKHDSAKELCVGFQYTLLGGMTDRYSSDMILQGTTLCTSNWESRLKADLEITSNVYSAQGVDVKGVAIVADTDNWCVSIFGGSGAYGVSARVSAILDALPDMRRARVPPMQCISFVEAKLRELCILSKTLAELLMTTDFCDMDSLTKALNIDVNDVPLLMAVATTHTPQIAMRYGISYR